MEGTAPHSFQVDPPLSVTTLHPTATGNGTVVVESYVVDIPHGNTKEETFGFVDTIVKCNLQPLAKIVENKF
ncbi:abscisic acid receptor PYL4-like protein [Tanacetum coccineum]